MNVPNPFSKGDLSALAIFVQILLMSSVLVVKHLWDIFRHRRRILSYSFSQHAIGMSFVNLNGEVFETRWNGRSVEFASLVCLEIENHSGVDVEDLDIAVTFEDAEFLLGSYNLDIHGMIFPLEIKDEEKFSVSRYPGEGWIGSHSRDFLKKHVVKFTLPTLSRHNANRVWFVCQTNNKSAFPFDSFFHIEKRGFKVLSKDLYGSRSIFFGYDSIGSFVSLLVFDDHLFCKIFLIIGLLMALLSLLRCLLGT